MPPAAVTGATDPVIAVPALSGPTVATAWVVVIAALMTRAKTWETWAPAESVPVTVKLVEPCAATGVPVIAPLRAAIVRLPGRVGATVHT